MLVLEACREYSEVCILLKYRFHTMAERRIWGVPAHQHVECSIALLCTDIRSRLPLSIVCHVRSRRLARSGVDKGMWRSRVDMLVLPVLELAALLILSRSG